MIGLLRKELYGLNALYKKTLVMVALLYGALVFFTNNDFFIYFGIFVMIFYSISNLSLDDASGWGRYARTLPVSDFQVVCAKFLVSILYLLGGTSYGLLLGVLRRMFKQEGDLQALCFAVGVVTLVSLLIVSFFYPVALKFGVEKARNGIFVLWILIFGGFMLLGDRLEKLLPLEQVVTSFNTHPYLWLLGFACVVLAALLLCLVVSCRIYQNKEF